MESVGVPGRNVTVGVDVEYESIQIDSESAVRYPAPFYPRGASSAFSVSVESWTVIPTSSLRPSAEFPPGTCADTILNT